MHSLQLDEALALLRAFEENGADKPVEAERLVSGIFRACGFPVENTGFMESGWREVDCLFETIVDGRRQRFGVEVKSVNRAQRAAVEQAIAMRESGHFDRAMVISREGFTADAIDHADAVGLGLIDLLDPPSLRSWLLKHSNTLDHAAADFVTDIIRSAMRDLAKNIAIYPDQLWAVEWRDLERMMRECFESMGFETRLTRPGKDGGFDLELATTTAGEKKTYLVEVKHWSEKKPGAPQLSKLIRVRASRAASGALLLSTSGFAGTVYSGITEYEQPVRLGDGDKVVSLCRAYYRTTSALWMPADDIEVELFAGTRRLGE